MDLHSLQAHMSNGTAYICRIVTAAAADKASTLGPLPSTLPAGCQARYTVLLYH